MATKQNLEFWMEGDSDVAAIVIRNKETNVPAESWAAFVDWWEINNADEAMELIDRINASYREFVVDNESYEDEEDE